MRKSSRKASKIMVIRHAEKPPRSPPPFGITFDGEDSKESLTVRGWQRAGALACLFDSPKHSSLAKPQFLFASKPVKRNGSKRPIETITPLAEKLGIKINAKFPKGKENQLLEEVFACEGVVLICWQYEFIPTIANLILGNNKTSPQSWPEGRFDMIWVFERDRTANQYRFVEVPQTLLLGDSTSLIK